MTDNGAPTTNPASTTNPLPASTTNPLPAPPPESGRLIEIEKILLEAAKKIDEGAQKIDRALSNSGKKQRVR